MMTLRQEAIQFVNEFFDETPEEYHADFVKFLRDFNAEDSSEVKNEDDDSANLDVKNKFC